jgi:hypothetical protein
LEKAPLLHSYSSSTQKVDVAHSSEASVPLYHSTLKGETAVSPNHWYLGSKLHSAASHMTVMFTFIAVEMCNLMSVNHVDKNIKETI